MDISFKFDPEVHIGADTLCMAGTIAARHGSRMMIAADAGLETQTVNRLKEILQDAGLHVIVFDGIEDDSTVDIAENIVELARAAHCDAIIGFGGQKAQIISRMAAIMAPMRSTAFELFDGRFHQNKFFPFIAIPTESVYTFSFTEFFIAADPRNRIVKSISSPGNLFSAVIIDSNLFSFVPGGAQQDEACSFVLESFFAAIEAYCSSRANFLSDALLERALTSFAKLVRSGPDMNSQIDFAENYAQASFLGSVGAFFSSPGIGSALSAAISERTPIVRPLCFAALFPCIAQRLVSARPEKMARIAALLGAPKAGSVADTAKTAVAAIRRGIDTLKVSANLKEHNIQLDRLTAAAEAVRNMDFIAHSPWPVTEEDLFDILKEIF